MYNVEKFIARAIESAINQSYDNIEIICVDDCGVDKSVKVAKEFAKKDKRVKIVQNNENLKLYLARVNGIKNARGDYILNLDGDDYLHKNTCLKCYEILRDNTENGEQIDFIMFNLFKQDEKDGEFKPCRVVDKTQIIDDYTFESMYFEKDTHFYNVATKCINIETYLKAIEFANVTRKITVAEDILVSMALLGVSKKIALLDEALYYYCYNSDSATRTIEPSKVQERIKNLNFVMSKFDEFANKKDKKYEIFMLGMSKMLDMHIVYNKMQRFVETYQRHIEKGYPKWLARLILSLQKKAIKSARKERERHDFVKENYKHFKNL